jgi:hypothetical protein
VDLVERYADILQIGARNAQNYDLLREVGRTRKPAMLKRGMATTIEEWLMAAEYIMAKGNENVMLCERGIRTFETATRFTLDFNAVPVLKTLSHLPVPGGPVPRGGRAGLHCAHGESRHRGGGRRDHHRMPPQPGGGAVRRPPSAVAHPTARDSQRPAKGRRSGGANPLTGFHRPSWREETGSRIVGIGLMGGSLGLALRRRGGWRVTGLARRARPFERRAHRGPLHEGFTNPARALAGADVVVYCSPVDKIVPLARIHRRWVAAGALVMDVGSVKGPVVREMEKLFSGQNHGPVFVGAHPMAGSEKTGVENARAPLYRGAMCVLATASHQRGPLARVRRPDFGNRWARGW